MHFAQANAIPLLAGIFGALVWANASPTTYENYLGHHAYGIFGVRAPPCDSPLHAPPRTPLMPPRINALRRTMSSCLGTGSRCTI